MDSQDSHRDGDFKISDEDRKIILGNLSEIYKQNKYLLDQSVGRCQPCFLVLTPPIRTRRAVFPQRAPQSRFTFHS